MLDDGRLIAAPTTVSIVSSKLKTHDTKRKRPAQHIPTAALIYMEQETRGGGCARGVEQLRNDIEERAKELAVYIIENRGTVRAAAAKYGVSKSTVHKDLTERLPQISPALFRQVRRLLDLNKAERHIRGGLATRRKYKRDFSE